MLAKLSTLIFIIFERSGLLYSLLSIFVPVNLQRYIYVETPPPFLMQEDGIIDSELVLCTQHD